VQSRALEPTTESSDKPEQRCFEVAFQAHWQSVYQLLFRLTGERAEAEDLAVEVFWRLHARMQTSGECEAPRAWLYRVAVNLGLNSLRARRRRVQYEEASGRDVGGNRAEESPLEQAVRAEERRQVHAVLCRLKRRSARLLILRYSGFSYAELARALGLSAGSVGTLLARAERDFEREFRALAQTGRK
jgi:RNA polymerase sigma-70 factor, ECF subfamily